MHRLILSGAACALALGLAACDSGGSANNTPDAGSPSTDAGSSQQPDAGAPSSPDAGAFTPGIQYNGSIAFERVTQ